ncbi:MAG: M14 family metallopeptidase [Alphaproteobacteria bacterium]
MTKSISFLNLPDASPGTHRAVTVHRYGRAGARPKVYIQAGLHADEYPPMLVAHHLMGLLDKADERDAIRGEIILIPTANPIGLGQFVNGRHSGRFDLDGSGNFNRNWPHFGLMIADQLAPQLGQDAHANVAVIRSALLGAAIGLKPKNEAEALKFSLIRLSIDADIVLDMHCDSEALLHMYTAPAAWPGLAELGAELGVETVLLAEISGGDPFDEAHTTPWLTLAQQFPDKPIPQACLSTTLEFRGRGDVSDPLALADAEKILHFLMRRGIVVGTPGRLPDPKIEATDLAAMDTISAPLTGLVVYKVALGDRVTAGDVVAEIVDPAIPDSVKARTPVTTRATGLVFTRNAERYLRMGDTIVHVAGKIPLPRRSASLLDA